MLVKISTLILELIGIVLLAYGYRNNKRNIMLAGAIILWLGASLFDFIRGFVDGARGTFAA